MQMATILPQHYLNLIKEDKYHMCLAHLLDKPGMETYSAFYIAQTYKTDTYVIMDNGLIEGKPQSIQRLYDLAIKYNINELVLPDIYCNTTETLKVVYHALDYLETKNCKINLMAVAHGKTLNQWLICAMELCNLPIKTLGIPKVLIETIGRDARLHAITELADQAITIPDIHLLGCWKTPIEIMFIQKATEFNLIPTVRGVDSAIPYVFARANMRFSDGDRPDHNAIDFEYGKINYEIMLNYNINTWRDFSDLSSPKKVVFL